jgi:hypothetical protein
MNNDMTAQISLEVKNGVQDFNIVDADNFSEDSKYSEEDKKANEAFSSFYQTVKPHFECSRDELDSHYAHIDFSQYFSKVEKHLFYEVKTLSLDSFLLYIKTMSGYRCYLDKFPEETDPLEKFMQQLVEIYSLGTDPDFNAKTIDIVYPYFLGILKY